MIVRMKKVTLLCVAARRDETLAALRDLGVMHLAHVHPPAGGDLDRAREHLNRVQRALEVLPRRPQAQPSGRSADEVVKDLWDLIHLRKEKEQALEVLVHERQRLEPYGSFDPAAVRKLAERGIVVRLYHAARGSEPAVPAGAVKVVLNEDRDGVYFAVVGRGEIHVQAAELRLPEQSLEQVLRGIAEAEKSLGEIDARLRGHAGDYAVVARAASEAEESLRYLEARSGMGAAEPVAYLRGFCPADGLESVRRAAASNGWGLIVEDPGPDDRVPTLIRNPRWVRPIETIFQVFGILPGYEEIDVSAVFLLFLSVFFAMIVGDAGYGLVFLALTLWAQRRFPQVPARAWAFMKIMSVCTILWGAMTGSYFFIPVIPGPLRRFKIQWLANEENVKLLSFLLGAIHLTIAHAWNAVRGINRLKVLAQFGWICTTWTMFFAARTLVLGMPFPAFAGPVGVAGAVAIALFMTPVRDLKTEWYNHVLLPFNLVGNFIDVVSYIRLYAVGVAGVQLAYAMHSMALSGVHGIASGLAAAGILFVAHALNIVLSAMAVLVHGVRLNVLEFSNHIGMQWSGFMYQPFSRRQSGAGART